MLERVEPESEGSSGPQATQGPTLRVTTPMRYAEASALVATGCAQLRAEAAATRTGQAARITTIDLSTVSEADSSALAVLFAWLRQARHLSLQVVIAHPPAGLLSLAALYGVSELLPLA